jgi:hypothetical protein
MERYRLAFMASLMTLSTLAAVCPAAVADDQASRRSAAMNAGYAGAAALSATLSRADVAVMRAAVQPNLLKAGFGEAHMGRHLVGYLKQVGKWTPLSARVGPQGIDGLLIRYDFAGTPAGLIVSEAKYGTSRLQLTADGIQMGMRWRSVRLARMASEYLSIARSIESGGMKIADLGGSVGRQRLQLFLPDGKAAVFARSRPGDPWEFVGPKSLMERAGRHANLVGRYLQLAGEGKVSYESAIYRVVLKEASLRALVRDASTLGERSVESTLPVRKSITLPVGADRLARLRIMTRLEVATILRKRYPALAPGEVDHYSHQIVRTTRDLEGFFGSRPQSVARTVVRNSLGTGGVVAVVDVAIQAIVQSRGRGEVNWNDVALSGGVTLLGTTVGSAAGQGSIVFMTENAIAHQFMSRTASMLGIGSRNLATNALGGGLGGGVASVLIAYGGYFAGVYDLQTANRMAIAGGAGVAAGFAFTWGMSALASAIGTASTGTAIASLGGAAYTSAALAWLGGGSVAAGGFGMAGGTVVLTGGVALICIGVGAAVYAGFSYIDRQNEYERIRLTLDDLLGREVFTMGSAGAGRFRMVVVGNQ